ALPIATDDGLLDVGRRAAPAPLVVGQVGETVGALGVGAVAHRAVGGEQAAAHLQGLLVLGHFLDRQAGVLGVDRRVLLVGADHFLFPLVHTGPAALAAGEGLAVAGFVVARQQALPGAQA